MPNQQENPTSNARPTDLTSTVTTSRGPQINHWRVCEVPHDFALSRWSAMRSSTVLKKKKGKSANTSEVEKTKKNGDDPNKRQAKAATIGSCSSRINL